MNLTPNEVLIISLVALIALGPKQLPEVARKAAKGLAQLRKMSAQLKSEVNTAVDEVVEQSHVEELSRQTSASPQKPDDDNRS